MHTDVTPAREKQPDKRAWHHWRALAVTIVHCVVRVDCEPATICTYACVCTMQPLVGPLTCVHNGPDPPDGSNTTHAHDARYQARPFHEFQH